MKFTRQTSSSQKLSAKFLLAVERSENSKCNVLQSRYIGKRVHGHTDTDTYGKDGQLWKRRTGMEKTDSYGKDGQLWKRRTLMEKTDTKHLKPFF